MPNSDRRDGGELLVEVRTPGILLVTLNRPAAMNAMTYGMIAELGGLWRRADDDPTVRVVLVTGAGRAFSAGNDLNNPDPDADTARRIMDDAARMVRGMVDCSKPIVSAINGAAVGAGAALAVMADVSIAAEDAPIVDGLVNVGVTSGDHAPLVWPLLCGMSRAKYYLFNLERLHGAEAARIGLVTRAVPTMEVLPTALSLAERLCRASQVGVRGTKRALNGWLMRAMPIYDAANAMELADFFHDDVKEGRASFREKRPPRFPSAN